MLCRDPLASYVQQGARLLVSGVLAEQRQELVQAFACEGMYCTEQRERQGWVVLEFQAVQSCEEP
jgi:ribosomal protein L11 methylase PrmA